MEHIKVGENYYFKLCKWYKISLYNQLKYVSEENGYLSLECRDSHMKDVSFYGSISDYLIYLDDEKKYYIDLCILSIFIMQ